MWIFIAIVSFFGTLIFIRVTGAIARRLWPESDEISKAQQLLRQALPTLAVALYLWLLLWAAGLHMISFAAIQLSIFGDAVVLTVLLVMESAYYTRLWRLRRNPSASKLAVICGDLGEPEKGWGCITLLLPFSASFIPIFTVSPKAFRIFLHSDLRLLDVLIEHDELNVRQAMRAVPHLPLLEDEQFLVEEEDEAEQGEEQPSKNGDETPRPFIYNKAKLYDTMFGASRLSIINRALNHQLPEELWEASCNLCRNTPSVIAASWKSFHFQDGLRLRLVSLFNTADLLQRIFGAAVLSHLRDAGALPETTPHSENLHPPENYNQWNSTLQWLLASSGDGSPELQTLHQILLESRGDFDELQEALVPFNQILGRPLESKSRHTLAGFAILGQLRNVVLGHGVVGWQLTFDPQAYLSAAHQFFLRLVRDLAALDWSIYAVRGYPEGELMAHDQGIDGLGVATDNCLAVATLPGSRQLVVLDPYIRFHHRHLLIFNRIRSGQAEYVDYEIANLFEPSYLTLPSEPEAFLMPRYDCRLTISQPLVAKAERSDLLGDLSAMLDTAIEHLQSGRAAEGLGHLDDVIGYCSRRSSGAGEPVDRYLAISLEIKGVTLHNLDRCDEAMSILEEAIDRLGALIERHEADDLIETLIEALSTSGDAHFTLEQYEQAADAYESVIDHLRALFDEQADGDLAAKLVKVWEKRIRALARLDRLTECVREYDHACALCPELLRTTDWTELGRDLAWDLIEAGDRYRDAGDLSESLTGFEKASQILRRLLLEAGVTDCARRLILSLTNQAALLDDLEQWGEALNCYLEAMRHRADYLSTDEELNPKFLQYVHERMSELRYLSGGQP